MGNIRMGVPENIVLLLKDTLHVNSFIETGTFKGHTAAWAARHFEKVITIENSRKFYMEASSFYKDKRNIQFIFGNSREYLRDHICEINSPAIFWLDAHWSGFGTYGENDQCPLLDELDNILAGGVNHSILIDDARLFLSPPPAPNKLEYWPDIDQIFEKFRTRSTKYYLVVFEDVLIAVPPEAKQAIMHYCQVQNTRSWTRKMNHRPRRMIARLKINLMNLIQEWASSTGKKENSG